MSLHSVLQVVTHGFSSAWEVGAPNLHVVQGSTVLEFALAPHCIVGLETSAMCHITSFS